MTMVFRPPNEGAAKALDYKRMRISQIDAEVERLSKAGRHIDALLANTEILTKPHVRGALLNLVSSIYPGRSVNLSNNDMRTLASIEPALARHSRLTAAAVGQIKEAAMTGADYIAEAWNENAQVFLAYKALISTMRNYGVLKPEPFEAEPRLEALLPINLLAALQRDAELQ